MTRGRVHALHAITPHLPHLGVPSCHAAAVAAPSYARVHAGAHGRRPAHPSIAAERFRGEEADLPFLVLGVGGGGAFFVNDREIITDTHVRVVCLCVRRRGEKEFSSILHRRRKVTGGQHP